MKSDKNLSKESSTVQDKSLLKPPAGKSGSNLASDAHSAAKRHMKTVKKPSVPISGAQKFGKPIFFNHLVIGVSRKPRKPASTMGRKRSTATFI